MALSGSLSTSKYEGRYYTLSWTATQDVATNKSTISWTIKAVGDSSSWYAERTLKAVIAGTTVYSKTDRVERKTGTVKTGTITLSHNTDGTKSFSASMEVAVYTSAVNCKGSSTFTLNTIPRASSVSATNANVGANSTISISRASSAFTHTLTYSFGSLTGTIASKTTSTSVAWTIPTTFYAQMTTVKSKSGTITCDTYSGSTKIGTKTCSFTASVPSTSAPTLNPSCYVATNSDTYKLTGSTTKFIKNYTYISYNMNASAQNSASLTSYTATCGEYSATTATGQFAGALTTNSASFSVTDSRGYTTSKTVNLDVVDYVKLTCSLSANMTVDGKVTAQISGNAFSGSFGATSNTLTIQYRYKEKNGSYSAWTTTSATTKGAVTYTANVSITGLDYKKRYVIQARATDKIQTVTSNEVNLNCLPVFDWGENDFNFNVSVSLTDGNTKYQLLGAAKALSTTYSFTPTITAGDNYTSVTGGVVLLGNTLRINFNATRNRATGIGNVTDETIATFSFNHGGKIGSMYSTNFLILNSQGTGYITNATNDGDILSFELKLAGVSIASTNLSSNFIVPVRLDLSKY